MSWILEEINNAKNIQNILVFWALVAKRENSSKSDQYWRDAYIIYNLRKSLEFNVIHSNLSDEYFNNVLSRLREFQENLNIIDPTFISLRGKDSEECIQEQVTYPTEEDISYYNFIEHICVQILETETTTESIITTTVDPLVTYVSFYNHICTEEIETTTV